MSRDNLRKCTIINCADEGKTFYFHGWFFESNIFAPSPLKGGYPGGVVASTEAILEDEEGRIRLVYPTNIKFTDIKEDNKNMEQEG